MKTTDAPKCPHLNLIEERLWINGLPVELSRKRYSMLRYFLLNPRRLITKSELLAHLWPDTFVTEALIKGYVRDLRRALGDDAKRPRFIETVRGRGYRYRGGIAITRKGPVAGVQKTAPPLNSIAILPFQAVDQDPASIRFARGLASSLVTSLSKTSTYRIVGIPFEGPCNSPKHTRQLGEALETRYLLDGWVERVDKVLRTNVRVLAASTGEIRWAQSFDLTPKGLSLDLNSAARVIVGNLSGKYRSLVGPGLRFGREGVSSGWSARDHILRGYFFYHQRTKAANEEGARHFLMAIALDPDDYLCHDSLAFSLVESVRQGWTEDPIGTLQLAHDHARKACQIDPTQYDGHWSLGHTYLLRRDYDSAGAAYETAMGLCPDLPHLIADFGDLLLHLNDPEGAVARIKEAQSLNDSAPFYYKDTLARAQTDLGDFEAALATYRSIGPAAKQFAIDQAALLVRCGRRDEACRMVQECGANAVQEYVQSYWWGRPYQDSGKAFSSLEKRLESLRPLGLPI